MTTTGVKNRSSGHVARRLTLETVLLFGIWLLLSGHYDAFHLGAGLVSVALVMWLNRDWTQGQKSGVDDLRYLRLLSYSPWLLKEMIVSAVNVARVILGPSMTMSPALIRFKSDQPNDLAKVILGNSITLTPGTLTIDIQDNEFLVHHLTEAGGRDLLEGAMPAKVAGLFCDSPGRMVYDVKRFERKQQV